MFRNSRPLIYTATVLFSLLSCRSTKPTPQVKTAKDIKEEVPEWVSKKYSYKPSETLKNDLLHTQLEVGFDWAKKQLSGKATLSFKPYFYPQNVLELDARGFDIHKVQLLPKNGTPSDLTYSYDGKKIKINLDKTYNRTEQYTVFVDYVAKPEELVVTDGGAISSDKGLFFIVPDSINPDKPRQIWTQGETNYNSCWFPTIDAPNEKTTLEIAITVENKYKTLSNGLMVNSVKNADGTRTDFWKQTLPHSPYLTMMALGEFAVVTDKWEGKEVSYYVEPAYEKYARHIFGNTPEMMSFFSKKLGYKYPWAKYSSVVVRDYVSGAMENTSATVFMDALQKTDRELLDQNWDNIIAHELFHHWFGDLVTCESWANLPLNESFANYSEYLWEEYKRGIDAADYMRQGEADQYLNEAEHKREPLIRYQNKNAEDMFDSHSYAKGGCILHMLRKYVGDDAFFETLQRYLKANAFKNVEIHTLRMAFEETTGEDLNWFFNQWFLSPGHPELTVMDTYHQGEVKLIVMQKQDTLYAPLYKLPLKVAIWVKGQKQTHDIVVSKAKEEFSFEVAEKPEVVLFDAEQQLLGTVLHKKTIKEFIAQYTLGDKYLAKYEAIDALQNKIDSVSVRDVMLAALNDPFWKIREMGVENLAKYKGADTARILEKFSQLALTDKNPTVKSTAIYKLSRKKRPRFLPIYELGMADSAYSVVAASMLAYLRLDPKDADDKLKIFEKEQNGDILEAISEYYSGRKDTSKFDWYMEKMKTVKPDRLYNLVLDFGKILPLVNVAKQKEAVKILANYALNNSYEWIRFSAYQTLGVIADVDFVKEARKKIRENEKSEKLKNIYKNMQ